MSSRSRSPASIAPRPARRPGPARAGRRACPLAWLLLVGWLSALDPGRQVTQYGIRHWGPGEGLPTGVVRALVQDAEGWLWVGTDEGLARTDGHYFHRLEPGAAGPSAPLRRITALAAGSASLWSGTVGDGLRRLRQGRVEAGPGLSGREAPAITALALARDGTLWVGTRRHGLYRLKGGELAQSAAGEGFPAGGVAALSADPSGGVWVSTPDGRLFRWGATGEELPELPGPVPVQSVRLALRDRQGGLWLGLAGTQLDEEFGDQLYLVSLRHPGGATFDLASSSPGAREDAGPPLCLLEDRRGSVWAGTRKGLLRVSQGRLDTLSAADGLLDESVTCLLEDREGNLWVGSRLGVSRLRDELVVTFGREQGLRGERVFAVAEGVRGDIWGGTAGGPYKIESGRVVPLLPRELGGVWVYDILRPPEGPLYLATRYGIARVDRGGLSWLGTMERGLADTCYALCQDRQGTLWAGTATRGMIGFRDGLPLPERLPGEPAHRLGRDLARGPDGTVWAATRGGLARLRDGALEPVAAAATAGRDLTSLWVAPDGAVWAGSAGAGLLRYHAGRAAWITTRQGLWHDTVLAVVGDGAGHLWMTCPQGIFQAPQAALEAAAADGGATVACVRFGTAEGMRGSEGLPAACAASDGRLWFGTTRGLCLVEPESRRSVSAPPRARWLSVRVDDRPVDPSRVELGPEDREIEIQFAAMYLRAPERVQLRFRLEGFDRKWSAPSPERRLRYTSLPPGSYSLLLQARLPGGRWGGEAPRLALVVRPPLWRTGWFQAIALVLLVLGVLAGRRGYLRLRQMWREWRLTHAAGPYRLREMVGKGGMGTVWRAVHRRTGQEAAVKVVEVLPGEETLRARFLREGLACERIDHPAVVRLLERGEDRGRLWYAMEFCRGRSLRAVLADGPIPPFRAARICRELVAAVQVIHARGVIHRDLKPDNIVLAPGGDGPGNAGGEYVRILDFGLARLSDQRTRPTQGGPAGTPAYLPPEYLGSGGREDGAVDLYATGVILYELLTGAPPYSGAGDDSASQLVAMLREDPVPPREIDPVIPAALSDLALRMIARAPADRLRDPEAILAALDALLEARPAEAAGLAVAVAEGRPGPWPEEGNPC